MFFTGKEKKTGSSKVLSEAEIKKKLYGDYETTSAGSFSASHEVKMSGSAFEALMHPKRDYSSVAIKTPALGGISKPESLTPRTNLNADFSDALLKKPFSSQKRVPPSARVGLGLPNWKQFFLKIGQGILGFVAGLLWKIGSHLVQGIDLILRILDPRKPQARKILYSITACVLVAALFLGVFKLNAQRKKAMLGELPSASVLTTQVSKSAVVVSTPLSSPNAANAQGATPKAQVQKLQIREEILDIPKKSGDLASQSSLTSAPIEGGRYVIQVATYAVLDDASRLAQNFNQAGFPAFFKKQIRNSTGHSFYPVYLGRFESSSQAQNALSRFRKASVARPFQDSFIRTLE